MAVREIVGQRAFVQRCDNRPRDEDWGEVRAHAIWACYGLRPAHVEGPQGAVHPDDLEVVFTEEGEDFIRVGRRRIACTPGRYAIIPAGYEHSSHTERARSIGLCVHLSNAALALAADELGTRAQAAALGPFAPSPQFFGVLAALKTEVLREEPSVLLADSLAQYLCGELLRRHAGAREEAPALAPDADVRLRRAIDLMHAEIGSPLRLEQLAHAAQLSRFRFAHLFKARFGLSPYAYLQRLRVELACERVRDSDEPLTAIALDLGFGSSSRLSEAFRRAYGTSPSAWRRAQQDPDAAGARSAKPRAGDAP